MAADSAGGAPPLRVLVVARWYPAHDDPGRGIFVADQVAALARAGIELTVASWETVLIGEPHQDRRQRAERALEVWKRSIARDWQPVRPRSWGAGVPVVRLPAIAPTGSAADRDPVEIAEFQAATLLAFGSALNERWSFDLVHAHTGLPDGVAAASLADALGLPLVVTEHDSGLAQRLSHEPARVAYRALIGQDRRLIAVSGGLRRQIAELIGASDGSIAVVPNAVDISAFQIVGPEARDPQELLWVGSRKASKGTDALLEAVRLVRGRRPNIRLRLIGRAPSDDEERRLRALAGKLGLDDAVAFEPAADRAVVAAAMARAAVFVHPSPRETFGVVAVEALASGLPVAATPSGGVDEIIGAGGEFGTMADSIDATALARAIEATLDRRFEIDPDRMRQRAESEYGADSVAARLVEIYWSLRTVSTLSPPREPDRAFKEAADAMGSDALLTRVPIVVGMRRRATITRVAALPVELATSLRVLTTAPRADDDRTLPSGSWTEIDPDATYRKERLRIGIPSAAPSTARRLARALRHPIRTLRLRRLARRRSELSTAMQRKGIRAATSSVAAGSRPAELLAIDADDVLLVEPLLGSDARLFGGTLRGLADQWDAAEHETGDAPSEEGPGS